MNTIDYIFRIQEADWDFGPGVGVQKVMCYHQFVDADGLAVDLTDPNGSWEPFIPGPEIRGAVGDTIRVTIQNRISDPNENFIMSLKTSTIVHWHGIEVANAHDGTPVTQYPIPAGQDYVYKFELIRPGIFWYHPHFDGLIQEHLGAYGPIIVEDVHTAELRHEKFIPHQDRTFHIALSDVSFQAGRNDGDQYIPLDDIPTTAGQLFIRNIEPVMGDENFGDVLLVNGKHRVPFNDSNGNFQQFWPKGERMTAGPIQANEGESFAFQLLNTGLHRFYRIHLAFRTMANGAWQVSDDLFWIGGQGGLLNQARSGGDFDAFEIGGHESHKSSRRSAMESPGTAMVQTASGLMPGEFLLPTSTRIMLAFAVQPGWKEVALRVNGVDVTDGPAMNPTTADEAPTDMIIASFSVGGAIVDGTYKLKTDIDAATQLLTNPVLTTPSPLEDLSTINDYVKSFDGCSKDTLLQNGVVVPAGNIVENYEPQLTGGGPSIDGVSVHWGPGGPMQSTPNNTRYVQLGDVVQWTIETTTPHTDHPWHLHGFSFQPIAMHLRTNSGYQLLYNWPFVEYVDSILVPRNHRLTFRFRVEDRNYIGEDDSISPKGALGRWLAHCHITKHAHRGMMMNFIVLDGCSLEAYQHVDVYLRDNAGDDGSEPQMGSISASPDVFVREFEVANPTAAFGPGSGNENSNTLGSEAVFGANNFIYTRVNNRGNQPGNVTTDVYWSEPSTLITPDQWNYIGQTDPMVVPPDTLTVSKALEWPANDVPAPGHYCFIGVTGSEQDIKPITPSVASSYPELNTFDDFRELIRAHNNITWRNFNVVVNLTDPLTEAFKFCGAFDQDRRFDLVIRNPFRQLVLEIPDDRQLRRDLEAQRVDFRIGRGTLMIDISGPGEFRLQDLLLSRGQCYPSRLVSREPGQAVLQETLSVAQEHVAHYAKKIESLRERIDRIKQQLAEIGRDENRAEPLLHQLQLLNEEYLKYRRLAFDLQADGRMEVGRVSWHFTAPK